MSLLRRCRVNAALTIQLFSQLFHFVNVWAFNCVVTSPSPASSVCYCSRAWGLRFKSRLAQLEVWAERQGLELAADCHLARIIQAAHLLQVWSVLTPVSFCSLLIHKNQQFAIGTLRLKKLCHLSLVTGTKVLGRWFRHNQFNVFQVELPPVKSTSHQVPASSGWTSVVCWTCGECGEGMFHFWLPSQFLSAPSICFMKMVNLCSLNVMLLTLLLPWFFDYFACSLFLVRHFMYWHLSNWAGWWVGDL